MRRAFIKWILANVARALARVSAVLHQWRHTCLDLCNRRAKYSSQFSSDGWRWLCVQYKAWLGPPSQQNHKPSQQNLKPLICRRFVRESREVGKSAAAQQCAKITRAREASRMLRVQAITASRQRKIWQNRAGITAGA